MDISSLITCWCAPPENFVKINVDAAVIEGSRVYGIGTIARDEMGIVLGAQFQCIEGIHSSFTTEFMAIRAGVLLPDLKQWISVVIEMDASIVVQAINQSAPMGSESNN